MDLSDCVWEMLPLVWLEYKADDGICCMLCTKRNKVPCRGIPTWTNEPCILLRLEPVVYHSETQMHRLVAKKELNSQLASMDGRIAGTVENVWETEERAMKACVYFMAKEENPHMIKYEAFVIPWSSPPWRSLIKEATQNNTSYYIVDQLLTFPGDKEKQIIVKSLQEYPFIVMRTTDLSSTKALVYGCCSLYANIPDLLAL